MAILWVLSKALLGLEVLRRKALVGRLKLESLSSRVPEYKDLQNPEQSDPL